MQDNNSPEVAPLISVDQMDKIRTDEVTFQTTVTTEAKIKIRLIKMIVFYSIVAAIVIVPLIFLIFRPKDYIVYEKYESIPTCTTGGKNVCYQRISLHGSGQLIFEGKINKRTKLSQDDLKKVKEIIRQSGIFGGDCTSSPVMLENKLTRTFIVDGKKKVIQYPDCDSEMDNIEASFAPIIK